MSKRFLKFLFLFAFLTSPFSGFAYERPDYIDETIWNHVLPYLMPEDHPLKPKLDKIFTESRVSSTKKTLKKAGFDVRQGRKWDNVFVVRHKKLKGYVLKLYTDDQMGVNEWNALTRRVAGARAIKESIDNNELGHLLAVPEKWIYLLPEFPEANPSFQRKNYILVADDMHVLKGSANEERWFGPAMDDELLQAVFKVITEVGLADTVFPDNMPFCADGRIAFVDTEHYHTWPIPYHRLMRFLAFDMQNYWLALIADNSK